MFQIKEQSHYIFLLFSVCASKCAHMLRENMHPSHLKRLHCPICSIGNWSLCFTINAGLHSGDKMSEEPQEKQHYFPGHLLISENYKMPRGKEDFKEHLY